MNYQSRNSRKTLKKKRKPSLKKNSKKRGGSKNLSGNNNIHKNSITSKFIKAGGAVAAQMDRVKVSVIGPTLAQRDRAFILKVLLRLDEEMKRLLAEDLEENEKRVGSSRGGVKLHNGQLATIRVIIDAPVVGEHTREQEQQVEWDGKQADALFSIDLSTCQDYMCKQVSGTVKVTTGNVSIPYSYCFIVDLEDIRLYQKRY